MSLIPRTWWWLFLFWRIIHSPMSAEDYNRCIVEVNQGDHISLALDKQVLGLLCLWGTHTYMTIIQLEQDNQCLRASNSSATIAFQVPRTNGPSHTPSSLFQPSQHLQHNQSNGQLRRINSQLPPPPPAVKLVWVPSPVHFFSSRSSHQSLRPGRNAPASSCRKRQTIIW